MRTLYVSSFSIRFALFLLRRFVKKKLIKCYHIYTYNLAVKIKNVHPHSKQIHWKEKERDKPLFMRLHAHWFQLLFIDRELNSSF